MAKINSATRTASRAFIRHVFTASVLVPLLAQSVHGGSDEAPARVRLIVIGTNAALRENSRAPRTRAAVRHGIVSAEGGTHLILAQGPPFYVLADRVIGDTDDREYLIEAANRIVMRPGYIEVAGLERFVTSVQDALATRFSDRGYVLDVELFGDGRLAPRRRRTRILSSLRGQPLAASELGDGLLLMRSTLQQPPASAGTSESLREEPAMSLTPAIATTSAEPSNRTSAWWWVAGGALSCMSVAFAAIAARRRRARRFELMPPVETSPAQPDLPDVLIVTETDTVGDRVHVIRDREPIPIVPGAALTFGCDPLDSTCLVRPVPGFEVGPFFSIVTDGTTITVTKAMPGVFCNGRRVAARSMKAVEQHPVRVQLGSRKWTLQLGFDHGSAFAMEQLFSFDRDRPAAADQATGDGANG